MTVKIDKDKPLPPPARKGGSKPKPDSLTGQIRDMQIGDSFFLPHRTSGSIGGYRQFWKEATGFDFQARTVTEDGVEGVRIWRIA